MSGGFPPVPRSQGSRGTETGRVKIVLQTAQPPSTLPQANEPCWCGSGRKYKRCHKPLEGRISQGLVSPRRSVPDHIVRPPYVATGVPVRWAESRVKTPEIIERMRHAGIVAAEVLRLAGAMVAPGVTTDAIDVYVHTTGSFTVIILRI